MAIHTTCSNGMGSATVTGSTVTTTGMKVEDHMAVSRGFLSNAGVVKTSDCAVTENGTPDRSVNVAAGEIYILNPNFTDNSTAQTKFVNAVNDATVNVALTTNSSGNPRIDGIFAKFDASATPNDDNTNTVTFVAVAGTPAASPTAPAAPSDGNYYERIANVTLANGYTQVLNANIADARTYAILKLAGATVPDSGMARQAIINGNFFVAQRGTTVTAPADASFLLDRWAIRNGGAGYTPPTIIHSRQVLTAGELLGSYNFYRINSNGNGSGATDTPYGFVQQSIEFGTRFLAGLGKKITVSFYARSSIANKKFGVSLSQYYGTGGSPTSPELINGTYWTLTSSFVKYTHTFTLNTIAGKTFGSDANDAVSLRLWHTWGTNYMANVGDSTYNLYGNGNVDIAQVQVCAGDVALTFQPRPHAEELALCQRYYEVGSYQSFGYCTAGTLVSPGIYSYKVSKRTTPTPVFTSVYTSNCSASSTLDVSNTNGFSAFRTVTGSGAYNFQDTWVANVDYAP